MNFYGARTQKGVLPDASRDTVGCTSNVRTESGCSARRLDVMEVRMDSNSGKVVGGIDPVLVERQPGPRSSAGLAVAIAGHGIGAEGGGRDRAAEDANSIERKVLRRSCMIPFGE